MEDSSQGADVCDDAVKRPIVLGIVDTSGMKSPVNRKRRWDQTELGGDGDASPAKVFVAGESDNEYEVAPEIPMKKIEEGTVEKSVISDSLKRIQFCYDQDTDSEEEESNDVKTDETKLNLELEAKASENVQTCDIEPKIESVNNIENKEESGDGPDVDPAVMEVIFGSDFEPKTDFNEESPKNVEIDNTEIITINPSDPLTEESMDMVEKSQENRETTDKEQEVEDMKSPLENQEDVFVEALETQENDESECPVIEESNSETQVKENIHVNSEQTQEKNHEQTQDILQEVQESIKIEEFLESSEIEENNLKSPKVEETVHLETAKINENVPLESVKVEENDLNVDLPKIQENIPMELNEIQQDFDEIPEMGEEDTKMADITENNDLESVEKELSPKNEVKDEESDYENLDIKEESVLEQESETQNSEDDKEIDENEEKDNMEISDDAKVDDIEVEYSEIKVEKNIPLLKTVKPILEEKKHERLSPITLRIDRGSPLTVDCKSPLGKSANSPHKQLEFTLKISKDANTNIPKATMSPKSNINLSPNSVWKLENDLKTSEIKNEMDSSNHKENVNSEEPEENIQKMIKKMLEMKEEVKEIKKELEETPTKVPRKRGRPRKIQPPPEPEPEEELDDTEEESRPMRSCRGRTKPIVVSTRKPRGGAARGGGRGRGLTRQPNDRESLSAYEKAELAKIEARKEKLRLDQIAKYKAIKEKKLAKKLKDEERRKRIAREKAEKAEAAAPQVFEEETRMSAPESGSRGHTPAPNRHYDHDESQSSMSTPVGTGNKRGRMEIPIDLEIFSKEVTVDQLAEYQWQGGSELYMIQEQVSLYLGVKSFKRKYPQLQRRPVEAEERTFLEDSNLVPKSMCDLGLTAVYSSEILDIMFQDFPDKYEEFRKYCREKQAKEAASKQKGISIARKDGSKIEPREQALEAVANWNANLNRDRREDRQCAMDLQTFTVHYPEYERNRMTRPTPKVGLYPIPLIPGQFCDYYKEYTPTELMYFPLNTVLYGPLKPNEKQTEDNYDSGSDTDETSSSDDSSETSSESDSSEDEEDVKCKFCSGTKKNNKNLIIESLLQCGNCKKHMHPTCLDLTPEMIPHIEKYNWSCPQCKKCVTCKESVNLEKLMSCDLCNRGYHIYCVGLKKIPDGRWHCTICSYCTSCGTKDPGGSDWQHEFKKSEKGAKIYQRTLCTPCFKLWRKGKYCQICYKCYGAKPEEDGGLKQCNTCDRWIHKECLIARFGTIKNSGFQCDICNERVQSSLGSHGSSRSMIKV